MDYINVKNSQSVTIGGLSRTPNFKASAPIQVGKKVETVQFDGCIESFVSDRTPAKIMTDVQQMRPFFEDKSGKIQEATAALDKPGVTKLQLDLKSDTGHEWEMSKTENGNYRFTPADLMCLGGQSVYLSKDGDVGGLVMDTTMIGGNTHLRQEIRADYKNGVIACLWENVEVSHSQFSEL